MRHKSIAAHPGSLKKPVISRDLNCSRSCQHIPTSPSGAAVVCSIAATWSERTAINTNVGSFEHCLSCFRAGTCAVVSADQHEITHFL